MTVAELISELKKFNPELEVLTYGHPHGEPHFADIKEVNWDETPGLDGGHVEIIY
jgi:hypothetical protein